MEYIINCPCCGNKIKIQIGDDGEISVISLIEIKIDNLDFGIVDYKEGGDKNGQSKYYIIQQ